MKNMNTNTRNNDEWLTPPELVESLGEFDLDPCQPVEPPFFHAKRGYNINDDGFAKEWSGRVWCNPPYGRETFKWLEKLHNHGNGIALIFARTETRGFHSEVWEKADAVFFFRGRIKFYYVDGKQGGSANAPSCLVAYGGNNVSALRELKNGKLVVLSENGFKEAQELTSFVNDCAVSHIESRYKYRARLLMSKYNGKE